MCPPTNDASTRADTAVSAAIPDCVPKDDISQSCISHAATCVQGTILNHSIRVFLYAQALAVREGSEWARPSRLPLLFAACILHDIGTSSAYDGPLRFEVEGADAAATLLRGFDVNEQDVHDVWVAIAVHTSPQIADRISTLARLVRLAVTIDFKRPTSMGLTTPAEVEDFENQFPRMEIEKVLGDAVADQAVRQPEKAPPATWPGNLYQGKLDNSEWTGVNKGF